MADRKWWLDGPLVSWTFLPTTMFSWKLPHLAGGLGPFFEKKDERHRCNIVIVIVMVPLWNTHSTSTFCNFSSSSHHISENKSGKWELTNTIRHSGTISCSSWTGSLRPSKKSKVHWGQWCRWVAKTLFQHILWIMFFKVFHKHSIPYMLCGCNATLTLAVFGTH